MRAWLVAGLLIVAVGACGGSGGGAPRSDKPMVFLEYEVAPASGQTEEQARDRAIAVMRARIDGRAVTEPIVIGRGPSQIHVQLQGDADELDRTIAILERSAALGVHPIVEDDATMQAIYDAAMQEKPAAIYPMIDTWQGPDGTEHRSPYVWSSDPKAFDAWLHARPPQQQIGGGRRLVREVENVTTAQGRMRWRTHVIDLAAIVTGKDVAKVEVTYDPTTMRPQVQLELTKASTTRFGDATAALVGHKLAIVLDEKVVSAPVVTGAIRGGRIVITMGAGDEQELERQAHDLVEVLKSGSMPAVKRLSERHVGPAR